jgi:MYXO-CTERM domain-containing protein
MRAGTFASLDLTTQTLTAFGRQWIEHTSDGIALGTPDMNSWTVRWAAPASDVGPVTFYAAGNAANGDGENMVMGVPSSAGDFIYTTSVTVPVPEPGSASAAAAALLSLAALAARARRRRC